MDPALADPSSGSSAQANGNPQPSLPQSTAAMVTPTFSANPRGAGGGFGVTSGDLSGSKSTGGAFTKLLSRIGLASPEDAADGQVRLCRELAAADLTGQDIGGMRCHT